MKENAFYTSKKFVYAGIALIVALVLTLLPSVVELDAQQVENINSLVNVTVGFGFALIGGHSILDALSMAKGFQVPTLPDAVDDLKDVIEEPAADATGGWQSPKAEQ